MGKLLEKGSKKWIFAAAAGLGVFIGFRYLFPLVTPFLLSFCIVYLCNPWLNRVQRKTHIRKEILLAGVMAGAAAVLFGGSVDSAAVRPGAGEGTYGELGWDV